MHIYVCVCVFHFLVSVAYSKNHEFKEFLMRPVFPFADDCSLS